MQFLNELIKTDRAGAANSKRIVARNMSDEGGIRGGRFSRRLRRASVVVVEVVSEEEEEEEAEDRDDDSDIVTTSLCLWRSGDD